MNDTPSFKPGPTTHPVSNQDPRHTQFQTRTKDTPNFQTRTNDTPNFKPGPTTQPIFKRGPTTHPVFKPGPVFKLGVSPKFQTKTNDTLSFTPRPKTHLVNSNQDPRHTKFQTSTHDAPSKFKLDLVLVVACLFHVYYLTLVTLSYRVSYSSIVGGQSRNCYLS